jgi:hypothetical protein
VAIGHRDSAGVPQPVRELPQFGEFMSVTKCGINLWHDNNFNGYEITQWRYPKPNLHATRLFALDSCQFDGLQTLHIF